MTGLFRFLGNTAGRITRIVAGVALILAGVLIVQGAAGWIIAIVGVLPLLAGLLDVCIFAPLARLPFNGSSLRNAVK